MKKIIIFIIAGTLIFSSLSTTFANDTYIDRLFDLDYTVEETKLNLKELDYIHFQNDKYNRVYWELKTLNSILKKDFMRTYRSGKFEYYQINGIITNYNDFIYHTNMFLFFTKIKEQNNNYGEIDIAISRSITDMRSSYRKVKNLIK